MSGSRTFFSLVAAYLAKVWQLVYGRTPYFEVRPNRTCSVNFTERSAEPHRTEQLTNLRIFKKKSRNLLQILIYILYLSQILIYTLQIIMPIDLYLTCYNEVTRRGCDIFCDLHGIFGKNVRQRFGNFTELFVRTVRPNSSAERSAEPNVRP